MTRTISVLALLGIAALVGCDDEPADLPVEVRLERAAAFRQACAARELLETADDDVLTLEAMAAATDPASQALRSTGMVALQFARVFQRHAEVRATAYALVDSAANHAAAAADSAQYIQRATAFVINFPQEGTIEANVLNSYETKFGEIMLDNDHRCNWDIPGLRPGPANAE